MIISFVNIFLINFIKLIKNENIYQFIISIVLISLIFVGEYFFINNVIQKKQQTEETLMGLNDIATYVNNTVVVINPLIEILNQNNVIINIIKLLFIYIVTFIPFAYIGSRRYLKKILSTTSYSKKKYKKLELNDECIPKSVSKAYIKNDIRYITRNATFLIQYIFPVSIFLIFGIIMSIYFKVNFIEKNGEAL